MTPRILTLDIETAPAHALVFGQWKQDISNIQIIQRDRMLGVGAKWLNEPKPMWRSEYHHGRRVMVEWIADQINSADIIVHFNGDTFDMPWLRREIAGLGIPQPAEVPVVDLCKVVKKKFRFTSNKLEAVLDFFDLPAKLSHTGFKLWRDIEVGTPEEQIKAWRLMMRYCKQDVLAEELLYVHLKDLNVLTSHPHAGLFNLDPTEAVCWNCNNCEVDRWVKQGFRYTRVGKYQRYRCHNCQAWNTDKKALAFVTTRAAG